MCLNSERFCTGKTTSNTKTYEFEYFRTPPEAVTERGYSDISGEVQKY